MKVVLVFSPLEHILWFYTYTYKTKVFLIFFEFHILFLSFGVQCQYIGDVWEIELPCVNQSVAVVIPYEISCSQLIIIICLPLQTDETKPRLGIKSLHNVLPPILWCLARTPCNTTYDIYIPMLHGRYSILWRHNPSPFSTLTNHMLSYISNNTPQSRVPLPYLHTLHNHELYFSSGCTRSRLGLPEDAWGEGRFCRDEEIEVSQSLSHSGSVILFLSI